MNTGDLKYHCSQKNSASASRISLTLPFNLAETVPINEGFDLRGIAVPSGSATSNGDPGASIPLHVDSAHPLKYPFGVTIYGSGASTLETSHYKCIGHANNGFDRG